MHPRPFVPSGARPRSPSLDLYPPPPDQPLQFFYSPELSQERDMQADVRACCLHALRRAVYRLLAGLV